MKIDAKNYIFRLNLANDLSNLKRSLERVGIKSGCLDKPIRELKDKLYLPDCPKSRSNPMSWGYKLDNLIIDVNEYEGVQYPKAKNIRRLKITLDVNIVAEYSDDMATVTDPYNHLEFNLTAEGFNSKDKYHILSYHLDRHIDAGNKPDEVHPIYHFQIGGRRMDKSDGRNYGNSLILDSPRLLHYPMDIPLGIDFITSNFAPKLWKDLRKDAGYITVLRRSQAYAVSPFVKSLSQYFKLVKKTDKCWNGSEILPQLI